MTMADSELGTAFTEARVALLLAVKNSTDEEMPDLALKYAQAYALVSGKISSVTTAAQ